MISKLSSLLLLGAWIFITGNFGHHHAFADEFDDAKQAYSSGDYAKCIELCAAAIDDFTHSQDWPILKIRAELTTGEYEQALETLDYGLAAHDDSIRLRMIGVEVYRFNNDEINALKMQLEIERLYDRSAWKYRDGVNQVAMGEYLFSRGADAKQVLDKFYNRIRGNQPALLEPYVAIGSLGLKKNDYALAAENFRRALALDANDPDLLFGMSQALAPGDSAAAAKLIEQALAINPKHISSLLAIVDNQIDAELYDQAEESIKQIYEINPDNPDAWSYRAVVAHLQNKPEKEGEYRKKALAHWKSNPGVDHLIGKKLAQKYRFKEAAVYQRRALIMDPDFSPAKIQLAQDTLRLGNEREGWKLAKEIHDEDGYNVAAYNLVTLHDQIEKYETLEVERFIVRMDPHEARLYGPRVLELLKHASDVLTKKYQMTIDKPVIVEIFARQQDFAIRTFGTPGGDGFLGVCFGNVVTMNSPSAQGANLTSWESVLWHEFCHVVTLQKTGNKMPRWLSEGISVYEENLANPAWGQKMNPAYRKMVLSDEDLTPVSKLSSAFLQPKSGAHLQFAYFESSLVVEYLVDKYGIETLRNILDDLRIGMPINESLARYTGAIELLDKEFAEYARGLANDLAKGGDLTDPEFGEEPGLANVEKFLNDNPNNIPALQVYAVLLIKNQKFEEAITACRNLIELGVNFPGDNNPYRLLSEIYKLKGEVAQEQAALENYINVDADSLEPLMRLMEIARNTKDWQKLASYAKKFAAVNPLIPIAHRNLAEAAIATSDDALAISSLNSLIALDPLDPAEAHFQLANAYSRTGEMVKAKRSVLKSLEAAPRYRAAHALLLKIVEQDKLDSQDSSDQLD